MTTPSSYDFTPPPRGRVRQVYRFSPRPPPPPPRRYILHPPTTTHFLPSPPVFRVPVEPTPADIFWSRQPLPPPSPRRFRRPLSPPPSPPRFRRRLSPPPPPSLPWLRLPPPKVAQSSKSIEKRGRRRGRKSPANSGEQKPSTRSPRRSPDRLSTPKSKEIAIEHLEMPSAISVKALHTAKAMKNITAQKKKQLSRVKNLSAATSKQNLQEKEIQIADHRKDPQLAAYVLPNTEMSVTGHPNQPVQPRDIENSSTALKRCPFSDANAKTSASPTQSESIGKNDDLVNDIQAALPHFCEVSSEIMAPKLGQEGEMVSSLLNWANGFEDVSNFDNFKIEEVGCYTVEPSLSPILKAITKKYGDIAETCPWQSIRSSLVGGICKVLQSLKIPLHHLTPQDFKTYYYTVKEAQELGLNVKWLLERLNKVLGTIKSIKKYKGKYAELMDSRKKELKVKKAQMGKLKVETQGMEDRLMSATTEAKKIESSIKESEAKCKKFRNKCLMDDLF